MIFDTLSSPLQKALKSRGFSLPTAIQEKAISPIMIGKDVMVKAQTGSGKSLSFILPILEHLLAHPKEGKAKIWVLVLTPTRELTQQVASEFAYFGRFLEPMPKVVSLIGGEGIGQQLYDIQQGCDIVVATTGRLLDIISKKQINLSRVSFLVLDEADKMLDLGFEKELDQILKELPPLRQNLLFSATYHDKMQQIAQKVMVSPIMISVEEAVAVTQDITQRAIEVNHENRGPLLRLLLKKHKFKSVLVFMANKRAADNIANKFYKRGYAADSFHGDLSQEERNSTLQAFKEHTLQILFSTDLAARGLHIEGVDCVINYDLPRSPTDYIHRIGRTGRAGKKGVAISFIGLEDEAHFQLIEKRSGVKLPREEIEGFARIGDVVVKERGKAPIKGKRKSKKDKLREAAAKKLS